MIDHVYVTVSDPVRSLAFYAAALEPLGWKEFAKYDSAKGPDTVPDLWGLTDGRAIGSSIWLRQGTVGDSGIYLGLPADDHAGVDAAYAAALAAGGREDGPPGMRLHFADGYYAANVVDLDGNRLEFLHKSWDPERPA